MLVEEVMTRDVITCSPTDKIEDIVLLMGEKNISGIPVLEGDRLVGIVTEEDIMRLLAVPPKGTSYLWLPSPFEVLLEIPLKDILQLRRMQESVKDVGERPISDVMTRKVVMVSPDEDIEAAAALMVRHKFNRLPVVKDGKIVGIIARDDIIHGLGGKR